jgi:hypothetical protein
MLERPKELVAKALRAGANTTAEGVSWLSKYKSYTMQPRTFAQLATRIRREAPGVRVDPDAEEAKKRLVELKAESDARIREMDLASKVRDLLRVYTAEEVHRMVGIASAILQG